MYFVVFKLKRECRSSSVTSLLRFPMCSIVLYIFAENSVFDVWQDSECTSGYSEKNWMSFVENDVLIKFKKHCIWRNKDDVVQVIHLIPPLVSMRCLSRLTRLAHCIIRKCYISPFTQNTVQSLFKVEDALCISVNSKLLQNFKTKT